jgi:P4 family phage/plasmid primase-like protien
MTNKISNYESVKSQILAIPPETLAARGFIALANDGKTYTCPFCGAGTHSKCGDGIKPTNKNGAWIYHCFPCSQAFNNLHIFAQVYGLNNSGKEHLAIIKRACKDFGFSYDEITKEDEEFELIRNDIESSRLNLKNFIDSQGGTWRGLTLETLEIHHCGFLDKWTQPKNILDNVKVYPSRRVIIPTSDGNHYNAVALAEDRANIDKKYWKIHAGKKFPFGVEFISSDTKFILVFEGEIDAMSAEQAINSKIVTPIATLGASEKKWIDLIIKKCSEFNIQPKFLILFDNDATGKLNAHKRAEELIQRGYPAVFDFLSDSDSKIDVNDILINQGVDSLRDTIQQIIQRRGADLDSLATQIADDKAVKAAQYLFSAEQYDYIFRKLHNTSDLFNARRIAYLWHNDIRYLSDTDNWANYDSSRGIWIVNPNSKNTALNPIVEKTAEILSANAKTDFDAKVVAAFQNQRKYSPAITTLKGNELITIKNEDFNRRKTVIKVVGGRKIAVTPRDLNTHKHLLNCENCVVDLQTGKTYDHSPDYNWTQYAKAEYRAGYHNEIVDTFLQQIQPNPETLDDLLRFFGYAITGECCEEQFLFMDGRGGNGKGTLTGLMLYIMNNYGCSFPVEGILLNSKIDANAATPAYNMLDGKRVSISEEIPANVKLNAAKIKILTGGDRIPIRRLHEEYSVIEDPTHTMIFSGNNLPEIGDIHDPGILRRLRRIQFKQDFRQNPNTKLKQQLLSADCRTGFLSVLVQYAQKWYNDGLIISSESKQAMQDYIDSQDFINCFISDYCERGRNLSIPRKEFLKKLQEEYPKETRGLSDRNLTNMIEKIDGVTYKRNSKGSYAFFGIAFNDAPQQQSLDVAEELTPDVDVPF